MTDNKHHIVAITALVTRGDGRFLILKRSTHEVAYPGMWALPGGKAERGESVSETLRREVFEEAGIEIGAEKRYLRDYTFIRPDGHNVVGFCFHVHAKTTEVRIDPHDHDGFRWILPEELTQFEHIPGMEEEIKIAYANEARALRRKE